ncbi:gamma-glutamylcyclotransferase [Octadecabacter sp. SW4]|uniref:gamma-glutamylcyclotransferase n=1 Tax=Octadecabacter sp. SW4 TaxID=2602067 RepID=UPI0011C202FC|nr:gamma-glutamylcyclotransferase [Octadecabacter sp. SW4]QEE36596.1 gamma-glutamylcyclotransferase [Octadecabacter sp. SW4]
MPLWVFGYGSLLWNPGFTPAQTVTARLDGYHRSFCMLSVHHRGTEDDPGLVLALDETEQGRCTGVAFRVADGEEDAVHAYLRERELISSAYLEADVPLTLDGGETVTALAYVINRGHVQYCQYPLERQAQIIARAVGGRGPNTEYLFNTAQHLAQMGIEDTEMAWLVDRVRALTSR